MDEGRQYSAPVTRKTLLKGMVGVAATAGISGLWSGSPAREANLARSEYAYDGQGPSVRVDLTSATGKTVQPYLYGYATGALLVNDCQLADNGVAESSAETLGPSLIRFNTSAGTIIKTVFANGVGKPDWNPFAPWVQRRGDFLKRGGRLIFGIGPSGGDTSIPPAIWADYARATAMHFREIGQEITYWEVGNECDPMGPKVYSQYFNAIADALHSVNHAYLVGGPVASWWNGIDLPAFVSQSGSRLGFIDFHSYPVSGEDNMQTAYERAAAFPDVMQARKAVAGTAAARLPIGLLEYNMNGDEQQDGAYGLPAQAKITGAVYISLLLTRAFSSAPGFTMAGLWDLVADSNYGVIGNVQDKYNYHAIDEQGWYLRQAARRLPGQQVLARTTVPELQVLATRSGRGFSIQLVNYNLSEERSVAIAVTGRKPDSQVGRWELSARNPSGRSSTLTSLTRVSLPPQSIVIVSGQRIDVATGSAVG